MRQALIVAAVIWLASCSPSTSVEAAREPVPTDVRPEAFVDAASVVEGLVVEMRYTGANNFVGRPVDGYDAPICYLTREAALALAAAQQQLAREGRGLKVYDCYRPARAVADFAAWARDATDQRMKADFYPNVDKARLFELGYIAERSGHSRGSAIDVTLIDLATGEELDMGTPWDMFDPRSAPNSDSVSTQARANRHALRDVMRAWGFIPLDEEWWHFRLENEPFPETYFDFPVAP